MNMYLADVYFGYFMAYIIIYAVIAGVWNTFFMKWVVKMEDAILEQEDGLTRAIVYGEKVRNSWMCKMCTDLTFKPLVDCACILLWPIYIPAMMITAIYLALKYLKVPKATQEEPA